MDADALIKAPFSMLSQPFIVQETDEFVVLFKPAFFHSVSLRSSDTDSLAAWYRLNCPDFADAFVQASRNDAVFQRMSETLKIRLFSEFGMVSRLDYQTSGLVAFAKRPEVLLRCIRQSSLNMAVSGAKQRLEEPATASLSTLSKEYLLLCAPGASGLRGSKPLKMPGFLPDENAEIEISSYFRSYGDKGHQVACIQPELLSAVPSGKKVRHDLYSTLLKILDKSCRLIDADVNTVEGILVKAVITRGFRHQIRAHCAWSGYPIIGDSEYGGKPASRLFLEAFALTIPFLDGRLQRIELYPESLLS